MDRESIKIMGEEIPLVSDFETKMAQALDTEGFCPFDTVSCPDCGHKVSCATCIQRFFDAYKTRIKAEAIDEFLKAIEKYQTRQDSYLEPPYIEMGLDMTDVLEVARELKEQKEWPLMII